MLDILILFMVACVIRIIFVFSRDKSIRYYHFKLIYNDYVNYLLINRVLEIINRIINTFLYYCIMLFLSFGKFSYKLIYPFLLSVFSYLSFFFLIELYRNFTNCKSHLFILFALDSISETSLWSL